MQTESLAARFDILQLLIGLGFSIILALLSVRFKALSRGGGAGMIIVGTVVFGLGGVVFAIPLIFFYVSSTILTFITSPAKRVAMIYFDKIGPRDFRQVLANGGVGTICTLIFFFTGEFIWFFPYLASICAAAADTWATERGTMSKQTPVSIVTLKKTEPGRSGAVTVQGFVSAAAGSALVTIFGYLTVKLSAGLGGYPGKMWMAVFNAGFAASILDSILGGSIQAIYRCPICNRITERRTHCGDTTIPVHGMLFVNNDVVNLVSVLFAGVAVALVFLI